MNQWLTICLIIAYIAIVGIFLYPRWEAKIIDYGRSLKLSNITHLLPILEIFLLLVFTLFVGNGYLDFNPMWLPNGTDFPVAVQSHFIWNELTRCGSCIFWNGQLNGGFPAFADLYSAVLHPVTIVTTLFFGVINGSKVLLICALFLAGLGQWSLGRVIGLGWFARTWAACLAVAGGHLAGKMELGIPATVLSIASASLILAPAIDLMWNGNRRATPWLAAALALTWLSGQGYTQIGVLVLWIPIWLILLVKKERKICMRAASAFVLSLFLAGVFLVPMLHFLPNFAKFTDPTFKYLQPFEYIPLNLVIHNLDFYRIKTLGHENTPYNYILFIGWIPVLLATWQVFGPPPKKFRMISFFLLCAILPFIMSSLEVANTIYKFIPITSNMRNLPMLTSLSVTPILGLAAWGMQSLLDRIRSFLSSKISSLQTTILIGLIGILVTYVSLSPVLHFSEQFYNLFPLQSTEHGELITKETQWIGPAFDDNQWVFDLLQKQLKVANGPTPWWWQGRKLPPPSIQYTGISPEGNRLFEQTGAEYASILSDGHLTPCQASAVGGNINVVCDSPNIGILTVYENSWDGWKVWIDNQPAQLVSKNWLTINSIPGNHTYTFRYQPWDVWVGISLSFIGIAAEGYLLATSGKYRTNFNIPTQV